MSAINVLVQSTAVQMMTDGSSYAKGGRLLEIDAIKAIPILNRRAALACTGPALLGEYLAKSLDNDFGSFDELVEAGSDRIAGLFVEYASEYRAGDAVSVLNLIGWHEASERPAAYGMDMQTDGPKAAWVRKIDPNATRPELFKLTALDVGAMPCPKLQDILDARYDFKSTRNAETRLLHMMEIQRHKTYDGIHYVGGNALLTSIDRDSMTQRVVHTWEEDKVGEMIKPLSIDYAVRFGSKTQARRT